MSTTTRIDADLEQSRVTDDEIVRIGLFYPTGGGEHEYYEFAEALDWRVRPFLVCAGLAGGENSHAPEAMKRTADIEALEVTARSLVPLRPDAVTWACTSGSFILGREYAQAQASAISAVIGCPAGSTSLAFARALATLRIDRVGVVATYPEPAANAFAAFLGEFGVTVGAMRCLGAPNGRASYRIPAEHVMEIGADLDASDLQALLIPDTAIAMFRAASRLEESLGKPVISANQATLWDVLRLAGSDLKPHGFGRLLAGDSAAA